MFRIGDHVYIDESSRYAHQIRETDHQAGTIIESYKSNKLDDDKEIWYRVRWANRYTNSYKTWDLRYAPEQFTSNKLAAKSLLKEEY